MRGRWSQKQWMSAQIFSAVTQEKGNISPLRETFCLWVENCLWHPCSYWHPSRVIETWITLGLIPLSCPWAWHAGEAWLFSSQPQLSFLACLYTADNTSQYISWAPHKGNHALEHEIITVPDLWSVILCNFSFQQNNTESLTKEYREGASICQEIVWKLSGPAYDLQESKKPDVF